MDRVTIDLENCYGIKTLKHSFDFSEVRACALYAPNGVMKSSLAQTFQDLVSGTKSMDRIFQDRVTSRQIIDQNGAELAADQVLVVGPYNEQLAHNEKTSTLMVDEKRRAEYARLHLEIDKAKDALLAAIKKQAASKKNFESEIASAFTSDNDFKKALDRIQKELELQTDKPFAEVEYDKIFDDRVLSAIDNKDVRGAIEDYVRRYNELLSASTFFKKGTFDYYNATQIATNLGNNGFFNAKHTVRLNSTGESVEIKTQKELETVIAREKDAIIKDKQLRKKFDDVAKALDKNATLRDFRAYMLDHEAFLSQLNNIAKFKEDILKSYLKANYGLYLDLMNQYDAAAKRAREIEQEAEKQRTQWGRSNRYFQCAICSPIQTRA